MLKLTVQWNEKACAVPCCSNSAQKCRSALSLLAYGGFRLVRRWAAAARRLLFLIDCSGAHGVGGDAGNVGHDGKPGAPGPAGPVGKEGKSVHRL
jgi:hypothetical protein